MKDYPDYALAYAGLADCWRRRGDLDRALAAAEHSYALEPQVGRFALLMTRFARGEDALDLFVQEAESGVRPGGRGFWPAYAEALSRAGRRDEVRVRLARLTDDWPTEPFAWSERALALCATPGATDEDRNVALQCAQRSVELSNRQGPVMLAALAEAHFQSGDGPAAVAAIDACLQVMAGRNAEWLTLTDAQSRRQRYLGR